MKHIKLSLLALLAIGSTVACAAETSDGAAGTGGIGTGVTGGTGTGAGTGTGSVAGTGGAVGTGSAAATGGVATGGGTSTGGGASGPTYYGQADVGITTLGVSIAKDAGGSSISMTKGAASGEVCFSGSTVAVTDWATQWGMSIGYDLAASGGSWDGSAATNITYGVSGTAPTLKVGLQDTVNKAGTDKMTFGADASVTASATTAISRLTQPAWTIPDGAKTLDKSKLTTIVFYIAADTTAKTFNFCITDPKVDGYVAPTE